MSETKFTKENWRLISDSGSDFAGVQIGRQGGFIVQGIDVDQAIANARLIAAAPDHDKALCMINEKIPLTSNTFGGDYMIALTQDEVDQIRSSLAKARGEQQ